MKKTINLDITNPKSIRKTMEYLHGLKSGLPEKCRMLCDELADIGVRTAIISTTGEKSHLSYYVVFAKELKSVDTKGCSMIMYGRNIKEVFGEDVNAAEVSPILMLEYGSGSFALPPQSLLNGQLQVGQGSFPGQKHAFDPNGWWYKSTKDGEWHHSYGITPSYPMQNAYNSMVKQVDKLIRRIFTL